MLLVEITSGIRGFNASASLKLDLRLLSFRQIVRIRGFNASASLKHTGIEQLVQRRAVSEALMPRPH